MNTQAFNLIFSKEAAAAIFNVAVKAIKLIKLVKKVVLVVIAGERPQFYSRSLFTDYFVNSRKQVAQSVAVAQSYWATATQATGFSYIAYQGDKTYEIHEHHGRIRCGCPDAKAQRQAFGAEKMGCCAHGYALLGLLGFDRLSDFQQGRFNPDRQSNGARVAVSIPQKVPAAVRQAVGVG